jgi:hypothetical protein
MLTATEIPKINRSVIARIFRLTIGRVGRIVPRRLRFPYARFASWLFRPVIAWKLAPVNFLGVLNSKRDLSLGYVMRAMTNSGCEFDVPMRVRGEEAIPDEAALFVSGHLLLAALAIRFLCETGIPITIIDPTEDEYRLFGMRTRMTILASRDKFVFVRLRNALRNGTTIAGLIDDASTGRLMIRPQALEVALRTSIPIVFFGVHTAGDGQIEAVFARPHGQKADEIAAELLEFIERLAPASRWTAA